jgi:hypothetical protein
MGWWPFKRKPRPLIEDPHVKGTRFWLEELRSTCERHFDNHAEGQRLIAQFQVEWKDASRSSEMTVDLLEGLERRAYRLLNSDAEAWLAWLDDEEFWRPGWRGDDGEPGGMD